MKILMAGATGLIGSALAPFLKERGWSIARLVRSHDVLADDTAFWDPQGDFVDIPKVDWIGGDEGFAAVVNLAGEDISKQRWTPEFKAVIRDSRVRTTSLLSRTLGQLKRKPSLLVNASAVGIYGSRGGVLLDEASAPGEGFLADVAKAWEAVTRAASDAGIRVVNTRFGMVLSAKGGAFKKMISLAKIGGAAPFGEGDQYMSWITIDDVVAALAFILSNDSLKGPVNVTSTNPMKNIEFSRVMQYYFKAPIAMHVPAFVLSIALGEIAQEVLLASQRAVPAKLIQAGFSFRHTTLEPAIRYLTSERVEGEV